MLKNEEAEPEIIHAARVRVTPAELADAIAILQARKDGDLGTISLGDAVQELNLDATPDDVLRVVQARREERQNERAGSRRKTRRSRWWALAAATLAIFPVVRLARTHNPIHTVPPPAVTAPAVTTVILPEMLPMSAVRDEQQVYADPPALTQIFQNAPPSQIMVHRSEAPLRWKLIKHQGKWYLQAVSKPTTETKLKNSTVSLYSDSPVGYFGDEDGQLNYNYLSLPIAKLHFQDSQINGHAAGITVSHVQPDSHLWEAAISE